MPAVNVDSGRASTVDERDLVSRAQAMDKEALSEIFSTYYPRVYSYGLYQLGKTHSAEDFASEVMLKVVESIPKYEDRGLPLAAWIFRIARNKLIDLRRRSKQRAEVQLHEDSLFGQSNTHVTVERALARGQVHLSLPLLTERQRQVVVLRFLQDFDVSTVARILGRSEGSVKSLQCRALQSLRRSVGAQEASVAFPGSGGWPLGC